jgi:riboflavin kinase / FMN adenylyltransferase
MEIIRTGLADLCPHVDSVLTIGTFDGVHSAHLQLIKRIVDLARENGTKSTLVTFSPHPRLVIPSKQLDIELLCDNEEKIQLLQQQGLDRLVILNFTPELSRLSAREFILDVLQKHIGFSKMVIGYNHAFGHRRDGNRETLTNLGKELGFSVEVLDQVVVDDVPVSSTKIRQALVNGRLAEAEKLLGRPYSFSGRVIHGHSRGSTIGFPTANLQLTVPEKLLPLSGVYFVNAYVQGKRFSGIMNLGARPTYCETALIPEVHLLDFSETIYGLHMRVEILDFIRHIVKFDSQEQLIVQLRNDRLRIQKRLKHN